MFVWPQSMVFHRVTLLLSSSLRVNKVSPLTWSCVCTFRGEKRRKRKEKEGEKREGKECARHLPGRITRFRCCVRMGGTGRGSFVVFTEILPLLLYLSAFYSLFFFSIYKIQRGRGICCERGNCSFVRFGWRRWNEFNVKFLFTYASVNAYINVYVERRKVVEKWWKFV